jgi:glycosyltransferase involved in cell wall biosynthesis
MTVDVVIPTTGRESLRKALESVRDQTVRPTNVFVVLDRSAEADKVREWIDTETLICAGDVGGSRARQIGVEASKAEFVAFLDDDDWWEPKKIEIQLAIMNAERADWSLTGACFHATRGTRLVPSTLPKDASAIPDYILTRKSLRYGASLAQSSTLMARTATLLDVGWAPALPRHQDWDLCIRLATTGAELAYAPNPLTHVAQGSPGSVSRSTGWRDSAAWIDGLSAVVGKRARADFVCAVVGRHAMRSRSCEGVGWVIRALWRGRLVPHLSAALVGLTGLAPRIGRPSDQLP